MLSWVGVVVCVCVCVHVQYVTSRCCLPEEKSLSDCIHLCHAQCALVKVLTEPGLAFLHDELPLFLKLGKALTKAYHSQGSGPEVCVGLIINIPQTATLLKQGSLHTITTAADGSILVAEQRELAYLSQRDTDGIGEFVHHGPGTTEQLHLDHGQILSGLGQGVPV